MMQMKLLGQSGLKIVPLVFGANVFGWTVDEQQSYKDRERNNFLFLCDY
jgi:aryl-alcohol dehydrogenase-like predicted oxidoreductase